MVIEMIRSLIIAFSMYSRIPMPRVEWNERSMKYVMCFFPLVGAVIGAAVYAAGRLMLRSEAGELMYASFMSVIPVLITGGTHMDGYIDTADALSSYGDREKKLEIMSDPHTGAFAIIWTAVYFVISLGLWSGIDAARLSAVPFVFVISRALSGLAVICFKPAKNSGLAAMFKNAAHKRVTAAALILWLTAALSVMAVLFLRYAVAAAAAAAAAFIVHYVNCRRNFGGITGDLAGAFLQLAELAAVAAISFS